MTMHFSCFNPQFYIGSRVGDSALDTEWAQSAGSYDHRVDVLIDAVKVLAAAVPADSLTPAEQLALERLKALGPALASERPQVLPRRLALRR
jgi:hypothetical protein